MHRLKRSGLYRARAIIIGAMLMSVSAANNVSASSADWQYGLLIYGWFPSLDGELKFDDSDSGGDVHVDIDKILDALEFTAMASFEARKGDWAGFTDVLYMKLAQDASKSATLPDGSTVNVFDADLELTSWVWTLGGAYTVWRNQGSHLDLLAGARLLSLDTDVELTGGGPLQRNRKLSASVDLWDGIVGVKGRAALNERWFLPYYADVGAGDTDLTWQLAGGIGYSFDWGDVMLEYRHLEYDQGSDKLVQNLAFSGGMLGVGFRF